MGDFGAICFRLRDAVLCGICSHGICRRSDGQHLSSTFVPMRYNDTDAWRAGQVSSHATRMGSLSTRSPPMKNDTFANVVPRRSPLPWLWLPGTSSTPPPPSCDRIGLDASSSCWLEFDAVSCIVTVLPSSISTHFPHREQEKKDDHRRPNPSTVRTEDRQKDDCPPFLTPLFVSPCNF